MEKNIKMNAILNTVKTVFSILFPLISFPYASRVLLPANIGKIKFGESFISYYSLIASLGITTYAIRECSAKRDNKEELSKISSQIFTINVFTTLFAYVLMVITLFFFRRFDTYRTLIIVQSLTILCTTLGCDWLNSAMEDFAFITVRYIVFQIIAIVLLFVFIREPDDYMKYAAINVFSASGANVVNIFYRRKFCKVRIVWNTEWKKHLKPIALMFAMILAQTIFNSSDITMLGIMKGDYEVGLYSTAVQVTNVVSQIMASLLWVAMPRLSFYFAQGDFDTINSLLKKIFQTFVTFGFPLAIGSICLAKEMIFVIAGEEYVNASMSLSILMVSFLFNLMGSSFWGNMTLLPSGRESVFMSIFCISTLVNVFLNYLLIPYYGAPAAAMTTAISYFVIWILCKLLKDKRIHIEGVKKTVVGSILGCVAIAIICYTIKQITSNICIVIILSVSLSVVIYAGIQIVLKNELMLGLISGIKNKMHRW